MAKQPLKVKLTENDIKKMVYGLLFNLKESFDNPFTMPESLRNNPLMEGIFTTYSTEDVEKYLTKRYGNSAFVDRYVTENGVELFRIGVHNDEDSKSVVNKDMALCGYFLSMERVTSNGTTLYLFYEPIS